MNTKILSLVLCVLFAVSSAWSQKANNVSSSYTMLWEKVKKSEDASLPESAKNDVDLIYQKALKEKNSPQLLKSMVYQIKYQLIKDKNEFPDKLAEMEKYTAETKDIVEQSVLHAMIAQLYFQYYQSDYTINQRTAITGYVPEDMREWSGNIFIKKIAEHVELSLKNVQELQSTDVLKYKEILTEGKSSRNLRPTMYDFLVYEGIDLYASANYQANRFFKQTAFADNTYFADRNMFVQLPVDPQPYDLTLQALKLYQQLISFRMKQNQPDALMMADLDRLSFVCDKSNDAEKWDDYIQFLTTLEKEYEQMPFCAEILFKEASFYLYHRGVRPFSEDNGDFQNKELNENRKKAYDICQSGIEKYPSYERIGILKNLQKEISQPSANINAASTVYPGNDLELKIQSQNISQLTIEIYRISGSVMDYKNIWGINGRYKTNGKLVEKKTIRLEAEAPFIRQDTTIRIPMTTPGIYEYVASWVNGESVANQAFSVSRLVSLSRTYDNKQEVLVTDYTDGKPVENAEVHFYTNKNGKPVFSSSVKTDKNGLVSVPSNEKNNYYRVSLNNDSASFYSSIMPYYNYRSNQQTNEQLNLFTDRSIYRPGQTVYFKGIAMVLDKDKQEIIKNKQHTLLFKDANGKQITEKTYTSNDFGSFSGEFVLPQNILGGDFSISSSANNAYCNFKVEEYKRPTFDIRFDTIAGTYSFGDQIQIKGNAKTFSGIDLQYAEVKYRITQNPIWFLFRFGSPGVQIAEGTVKTDEKGAFDLSFVAEKTSSDRWSKEVYYSYNIEVSVTDTNGETQESSTQVPVGDKSMHLTISELNLVDKDKPENTIIQAYNLNGKSLSTQGTYQVFRLKAEEDLDKTLSEKDWKKEKEITSGNFTSGEKIDLSVLSKEASGKYRIIVQSKDDKGRDISKEQDFTLYSTNDKRPPVVCYDWLISSKTACAVGENTEIIYGSSAKDVHVLYEIFKDEKLLERNRFTLNDEIKRLTIPFKESYEDGIIAKFTFIKKGKLFAREVEIRRKQPDKKLTLKMDVFRNKLLPGQKEEWKISVKDADKNPVLAEILAGMYDASLDKLYAHAWSFDPTYHIWLSSFGFNQGRGMENNYASIHSNVKRDKVPEFAYDSFNWFGLNFHRQLLRSSVKRIDSKVFEGINVASIDDALQGRVAGLATTEEQSVKADVSSLVMREQSMDMPSDGGYTLPKAKSSAGGGDTGENTIQIRTNFNETAFFYPQLRTNEAGETLISFTVPESNTTWKLMTLAHTKDLKYGELIEQAISQKELMITPNMPRFIRHGDLTTITTNISNLSDQPQNGKVSIELFDPQTEKIIISVDNQTQNFSIEQGETTSASWSFEVPGNIELVGCRIIARSEDFSDGEQHLLPVLPNRMLVTESLPIEISGKESKQFSFDKLIGNKSETAENYRLILEFAANPTWYAVQALPAITTPNSDNVISWFAAFYANNLATSIANSTLKIKQIIDTWTKQGGNKETLISNLEKNQELKAVLLEETPWVLEATNETEQKQRLSLLFDINRNNNLSSTAISKLKELQLGDGGWSWFKGMYSSPSITQWILYGFGQLDQLNALSNKEEIAEMQQNAISFIDRKFKEHFDQMKKYNKNWSKTDTFSSYELEYLFVRSFYKDIPFGEADAAAEFYSGLVEKFWTKNTSLYLRSLASIVMQRNGNPVIAQKMIESLRQHAVHKPELGMYWANNNASAFFFQSATSIHTFIMQAFEENKATSEEMDAMKLWLLKQKQTQEWESTPATTDAIYVLLKTGNNWLASEGNVDIKLGNKTIDTTGKEAGTGYIKQVYSAQEITPDMGKVSVSKQDAGPAWGALYWQYFEDLDKITEAKTGLNVEKKLFIERVSEASKILDPNIYPLHVGDKVIVRLTLRNDRDMEYVMLKDLRGACFEPAEQISGLKWKESVMYYQTNKDASTALYFSHLPKGTYVFEYPLYVVRDGEYSNGLTTIQCLYAPEFVSHTKGERVTVIGKGVGVTE